MGFSNISKYILFGFCFVFGQLKTESCPSSADNVSIFFPPLTNCLLDYRSGPDESSTIGLLGSIYKFNSDKNESSIRNHELLQVEITGTTASPNRFVPFHQWLHYRNSSNLNDMTNWKDLKSRQDGIILESLNFSFFT